MGTRIAVKMHERLTDSRDLIVRNVHDQVLIEPRGQRVVTLPAGRYVGRDNARTDKVDIYRLRDGEAPDYVMSLPGGLYQMFATHSGTHIYFDPDQQGTVVSGPARAPVISQQATAHDHIAGLRAINERHRKQRWS